MHVFRGQKPLSKSPGTGVTNGDNLAEVCLAIKFLSSAGSHSLISVPSVTLTCRVVVETRLPSDQWGSN